jgi:uncharacterized YigZ family protein
LLFDDTYKTILHPSEGQFKDRGSRFIGLAFPAQNEMACKQCLDDIRKKYHDACHHCYAYMLGFDKSAFRINDDGEPSGTAGKPIYGQILSHDLTNVLIIVVRYFGGTKLGVPGLINAYREAAAAAINNATIIEKTVNEYYAIQFPYEHTNLVMKAVKDYEGQIIESMYLESCAITVGIRRSLADRFVAGFALQDSIHSEYLRTC